MQLWRVRVAVLAALAAVLLAGARLTCGGEDRRWPDGVVDIYDAAGMNDAIVYAAQRWTRSGAHVHVNVVLHRADADVILDSDDARLQRLCGAGCLGHSTAVGRPPGGRSEILVRSTLTGSARPLSVWVAAHELGHVLGLRHHTGTGCALMASRAYDSRCAPTLGLSLPTTAEVSCMPAPPDVAAAAKLYGGAAPTPDPRCH